MKKRNFIILIFLLEYEILSQSVLGFQYPFGIPLSRSAGYSFAMGGGGTALQNDLMGHSGNPANLGASGRTAFSSVFGSDIYFVNDNTSASQHLDMNIRLFSLTIPFGRFGSLGLSFEPYSNSNLRFRTTKLINIDNLFTDTAVSGILSSGGVTLWQAGWGFSIKKALLIGIGYARYNFDQTLIRVTEIYGTTYNRVSDSTRVSFATNGISGGVILPFQNFSFGLKGTYFFINSATTSKLVSGILDTSKIVKKDNYQLKPPPELTIGGSWKPISQLLITLDVGATLWSKFYSDLSQQFVFENAYNTSLGMQFVPAPELVAPKLHQILQYKAGFRYSQLPIKDGYECSTTIGIGIPLNTNGGLFDIVLEYCSRSDKRYSEFRENILGLRLGITGARKWYQPTDKGY